MYFGSSVHKKAADIVIADKNDSNTAYIIVECKKPKRNDGIEQLKSYCNAEGSPIGVWTNGGQVVALHREEPNIFRELTEIPSSSETLSDILNEKVTLKDLINKNKLVHERTTLKEIILDIENLVLANAGVDAFDEIFKLVYAKLYDEWRGAQSPEERNLKFRVAGSTPAELYEKIDGVFDDAKKKWPGVFYDDERIDLTPSHLVTCVSLLEDIRLFNSNLQVIDEAFEYLSVEVGKGKKGQYFTPRHVIDMAVKMLSPHFDEYTIDTASGSCGFTVHSIFHVWGNEFQAGGPVTWQAEYAREKVFALDFDSRSIKIAKAINPIAGDGRSNVYRANTLDSRHWSEEVKTGLKHRLRKFPKDKSVEKWNEKNFRFFDFDVLMTNPPFAGDIRDSRILHQYDLAKGAKNKWRSRVGRDILFIERNMEFLKPGGRMAIVLPQGRLNNSKEDYIRRFLAEHGRILGIVGLHINMFKPHTGTKTSIVFWQKWNDDPKQGPFNPVQDDYPIFMATNERPGKANSGDYVFVVDSNGEPVIDSHGHLIVDHDLGEIADAFIDWAKKHSLSFVRKS